MFPTTQDALAYLLKDMWDSFSDLAEIKLDHPEYVSVKHAFLGGATTMLLAMSGNDWRTELKRLVDERANPC